MGRKCDLALYMGGVFLNEKKYYTYLPLNLIYDTDFSDLSIPAIVLYSIMLNRKKLSLENPLFRDSAGTFIFFSNPQIRKALRCNQDTARKTLNELENYGLVRKEYQKRGQPLKIYVNDIFHMLDSTHKVEKEQLYKPNFNPRPSFAQKEVSFDVEKAEEMAKRNRCTFGDKPKRRTF